MSVLEKTLIKSATLELQMLVSLCHDGDLEQKIACYNRVSALAMIAFLQDNGLTEQGEKELIAIDKRANLLMNKPA